MRSFQSTTRIRTLASLGAIALVAAACSSSGGAASPSPSVGPSVAAPSEAPPPSAATEATVAVATGDLGDYLVGPDGKTLYLFTPDSANASTCEDGCAQTWPPFIVEAGATPAAGDGVTGTLSTFARSDGSLQIAINGVPLYYYAADAAAGDTSGQGVGGKWFIVSSSGEQVAVAMDHTVAVGSGALGDILTGLDGKTLYIFTPDSANTSTCVDACAENWPPLTVEAGATPDGDAAVTGAIATVARPDGSLQVTINGWPLYYFVGDQAAGDTKGQGLADGKWLVVSPAGEPAAGDSTGSAY